MLNIKILTAHPDMFPGTLGHSILGKALHKNFTRIWSSGYSDKQCGIRRSALWYGTRRKALGLDHEH